MSYGPGRSRLVQGTLVGALAWIVGCLLAVVALVWVFGVVDPQRLTDAVLAYSLVVVWFVLVLAMPGGGELLTVLIPGAVSSAVLLAAGAIAVGRVGSLDSAWDGAKVGGTVAIGHGLVMAVAFASIEWTLAGQAASFRTFALTFGGFVVPAAFGAAGGVLRQQFSGQA